MAGVSSKFVDVERLTERFLECDICKEIFDEENHHPRLLPCLHTLCKDCIVKLVADEQIRCPKCQHFHRVPGNCIETFKKDNTRRDLLDFVHVQKEPSSLQCESCDKKLPAKFRCKNCSEFICTECNSYHVHNKKFKTHYVFSIDSIEFQKAKLENFIHESSCSIPEHSDALKFYCDKGTCKKPICTTCAIAEHKESNGHIVRDVLDVYSQEKTQMELKKSTLEKKQETALDIMKCIEREENDLHQHEETAKENIMTEFETCFKILERRRDQLLQDVDVTITRKNKVLEVHRQELESLNELITDAVSFYDQSLLFKNYSAFLEIVRTIEDRFKYLIDQKIDPVPHENACVEFTPTNLGMEFQTYANTTGKVYHTSVYPPNTMIETKQLENQEREVCISVTFRDESNNEITDSDTLPDVIVKIHSEKEPMASLELPCELSETGRYKAVTKDLSPGKYKIEAIVFQKCFGADVKEIEYKEDEHQATLEDGKSKDQLTTPISENKTTAEDKQAKDQLTTPIAEHQTTLEYGKSKDQLTAPMAENKTTAEYKQAKDQFTTPIAEHQTTLEDGKSKDQLTTPILEHKTTAEDKQEKNQLTTPIVEHQTTLEDGKSKDQLTSLISEPKTTAEDKQAKDQFTTPIAEHQTTAEDGKSKDQLTTPISEPKTTADDKQEKNQLTTSIADHQTTAEDKQAKDQLTTPIAGHPSKILKVTTAIVIVVCLLCCLHHKHFQLLLQNQLMIGCESGYGCFLGKALSKRTPGDVMSFTFDPLTLHKNRYISDDCLTISNVKQEDTHMQMNEEKALKVYGGVRGSAPITYPENCIIEVEIKYKIIGKLTATYLVFDIGFIKEEEIDTLHYCKSLGIYAAHCESCQMVCLFMNVGNKIIKHIPISNKTKKISYTGTFIIFINSKKGEIEVFDEHHVQVYLFTDVDFRNELWPMFGVYNDHLVNTRLRLIKAIRGKDLKLHE